MLIATLLALSSILLLPRAAHADQTLLLGPLLLPSIMAVPMPAAFTAAALPSSISAAAATAALTPLDYGFLARVARLLDGLKPRASGNPRDPVWRNPTLRDPARERDATSFGIRSAPMSPSGAAFVGAGAGAGAAQLVDLAGVGNKLPVKITPSLCQGGGGISIKFGW